MQTLLRDFLLSYCPAAVRRTWRPESLPRTLRAATWGGLAQLLLAGFVMIVRLKSHFILRAHQLAPQAAGSNETGQAIFLAVLLCDYLLQPVSLFLVYVAVEGAIRFTGGFITGEIIPSMMVFLSFKSYALVQQLHARQEEKNIPVDLLEFLPESRVRIASATTKPGWNGSLTIGLNGKWLEVEREDTGTPPHIVTYILRPVSPGKILRRYEEYDAASASTTKTVGSM